jgi:hypothetical protein
MARHSKLKSKVARLFLAHERQAERHSPPVSRSNGYKGGMVPQTRFSDLASQSTLGEACTLQILLLAERLTGQVCYHKLAGSAQ